MNTIGYVDYMDKVWELLNYPKNELIKDVRDTLGCNKTEALSRIQNGWIKPSSTKAHFRFYVKGYKFPILTVESEGLMNFAGGFIDTFIQDYRDINFINQEKFTSEKKVKVATAITMKGIWGKPDVLRNSINEIKGFLIDAKVDRIESPRIADETASDYNELLKEFDLRLGQGIRSEWGTIRLLLKWAERIDYEEYLKIRNNFQLEDWENMVNFESALCKKRDDYDPVGILDKDKNFAHLFQFDILKDVINEYDDHMAELLVNSSAWLTKNMFKDLNKSDWLAVSTLYAIGSDYMWISGHSGSVVKPERFRQEFNIPKKSFYRKRDMFKKFIELKLPGQPQKGGSIEMDPPTFLDIF